MSLIHQEPGLNRSFLKNLFNSNFDAKTKPALVRVSILFGAYAFWVLLFRLIAMTFVIYFLTRTSGKQVLFEEVNETFGAHELSIIGFGAAAFVLLLKGFAPVLAGVELSNCILDGHSTKLSFLAFSKGCSSLRPSSPLFCSPELFVS